MMKKMWKVWGLSCFRPSTILECVVETWYHVPAEHFTSVLTRADRWAQLVLLLICPATSNTWFKPLWVLGVNTVYPRHQLCLLILATSCFDHSQGQFSLLSRKSSATSQDQSGFLHKLWKTGRPGVVFQNIEHYFNVVETEDGKGLQMKILSQLENLQTRWTLKSQSTNILVWATATNCSSTQSLQLHVVWCGVSKILEKNIITEGVWLLFCLAHYDCIFPVGVSLMNVGQLIDMDSHLNCCITCNNLSRSPLFGFYI